MVSIALNAFCVIGNTKTAGEREDIRSVAVLLYSGQFANIVLV